MASNPHSIEAQDIDPLRRFAPFARCSPNVSARLEAIAQSIRLPAGETLVDFGESEAIVFIAGGTGKLVALTQPERHILSFQFPGDIVTIAQGARGGTALVALSELDLVLFDVRLFLDAAEDDPALLRKVLVQSLETIQRNRTRMMRLGHRSARQRIAGFLVTMAERICGCTAGECEFALPMGRGDIGDSLGLTIETVSRQFTELRNEGLVTTRGRAMVQLSDIEVLRREAGP